MKLLESDDGRRRCDDRCITAKGQKCNCICGGEYHGTGRTATELAKLLEELDLPVQLELNGTSQVNNR